MLCKVGFSLLISYSDVCDDKRGVARTVNSTIGININQENHKNSGLGLNLSLRGSLVNSVNKICLFVNSARHKDIFDLINKIHLNQMGLREDDYPKIFRI